jgi:poly(ribitol-phosphate) beta-N-acetylglucosaminyltransferase
VTHSHIGTFVHSEQPAASAGQAGDRSWLVEPRVRSDASVVRRWHREANEGYGRAVLAFAEVDPPRAAPLGPGISVVVPSHRGREHIGRCLRSLAGQTLDREMYEILLVLNGPPDGTDEVVDGIVRADGSLPLRVIRLATAQPAGSAGAARARNAGIAAARREYTTFVDDDDYVSPGFLETLLAHARPDVVPVAALVDVHGDREDPDNRINRALLEHAGDTAAAGEIPAATSFNAAKAVSTRLIQGIGYDVALASGEDVLFWLAVVARGHVLFRPCPAAEGAVYYRVLRAESVSRPGVPAGPERGYDYDFAVTQRLDVIARLERLAGDVDPGTLSLLDSRIRAQTGFIGDYLSAHPDDHARVVAAVRARGIERLPYDRMNADVRPRGLAIAYAFPPYADTSAVVSAKRLRDRAEVVDVVYNAMDSIRSRDESLRRIAGPYVARQTALDTPSYFSDWGSMEAFAVEGMRVIRRWELARGSYHSVYSRAQFAASHFLAAAYKLSNPTAFWTAEFSDPLSRDIRDAERGTRVRERGLLAGVKAGLRGLGLPVPSSRNCMVWCEELAYALADELLFTNVNQLEYMLGYCANPGLAAAARAKAVIAPHPTLPPEFYTLAEADYPLGPERVHLAYFGTFYETRGIDDILAALAAADEHIRDRVQLHVFTSRPADVAARAAVLGVGRGVRAAPYVRFLEFLNLTTRFDALVVNDAVTAGRHSRNPYLPSKWSDYRGSGAPVWGLVEDGSPLSREPLDHSSPVGDVAAAVEVLAVMVGKRFG